MGNWLLWELLSLNWNEAVIGLEAVSFMSSYCTAAPHILDPLPITMPTFSFAYGSFGDILATAQLVVQIISTLRCGGRPSPGWTETENELKGLGNDLAHLTLNPPSDPYIAARVHQEVARCHRIMVRFFARINSATGLVRKLMWAASEERELAAFKTQVIERRAALGVLLGLMNSGALAAVQARVHDVCDQVGHLQIRVDEGTVEVSEQIELAHARVNEVGGQVEFVHAGVDEVGEQVEHVRARVDEVGSQVGHVLVRVDEVSSQVSNANAIACDMRKSITQQLTDYHAQITAVISHVPHGVPDPTFVVLSPTGARFPISVIYCTSYEVLDGLLKMYMRGRREVGSRYVERGDYTIAWQQGRVIEPAQFMRTVQAGMHLEIVVTLYPNGPEFFRNAPCPSCGNDIIIQELLCEFRWKVKW
ncbi:hypothetical protein K438DRAFT_307772 [Mycena galopus ATCC 62051]|nr:hypothetical protein K438DRAFT_307772 [Mycena galopus ATCC 62051]